MTFDVRVQLIIEEFIDKYERFPISKATLNRRVNRVVNRANVKGRVYPHSLRATAASLLASRDVSLFSLMSFMGWNDIETARSYLSSSEQSAAREIRNKYR